MLRHVQSFAKYFGILFKKKKDQDLKEFSPVHDVWAYSLGELHEEAFGTPEG